MRNEAWAMNDIPPGARVAINAQINFTIPERQVLGLEEFGVGSSNTSVHQPTKLAMKAARVVAFSQRLGNLRQSFGFFF